MILKTDYNLKKKKIIIATGFSVVMCFCCIPVFAGFLSEPLAEFAEQMATFILTGFFSSTNDLLALDFDTSTEMSLAWNAIVGIYDYVKPVGYSLLLLYFLLELLDKTSQDNFNLEHFVRLFIKLIVGVVFINNCLELFKMGLRFSSDIVNKIIESATITNADASLGTFRDELADAGFLQCIVFILMLFLPMLLSLLASLVMNVVVYARMIELCVRATFAPIGMVDLFVGGSHSNGIRYFKKFVAVGLQGAIIAAIIVAMWTIQMRVTAGAATDVSLLAPISNSISIWGMVIKNIIIELTAISLIIKSQSWANDLLGV